MAYRIQESENGQYGTMAGWLSQDIKAMHEAQRWATQNGKPVHFVDFFGAVKRTAYPEE